LTTLNPSGTLLKAALLSLGCGVGWALLAVWLIYAGSTLLPPRLRVGEIWPGWRRKWWLWAGALALTILGCAWSTDWLLRNVAWKDLYWLARAKDMALICRTGGASGYLLVLALFTGGALLRKRAQARQKTGSPAKS